MPWFNFNATSKYETFTLLQSDDDSVIGLAGEVIDKVSEVGDVSVDSIRVSYNYILQTLHLNYPLSLLRSVFLSALQVHGNHWPIKMAWFYESHRECSKNLCTIGYLTD